MFQNELLRLSRISFCVVTKAVCHIWPRLKVASSSDAYSFTLRAFSRGKGAQRERSSMSAASVWERLVSFTRAHTDGCLNLNLVLNTGVGSLLALVMMWECWIKIKYYLTVINTPNYYESTKRSTELHQILLKIYLVLAWNYFCSCINCEEKCVR